MISWLLFWKERLCQKILITGAHGQLGTELCHLLDEKEIAYDAFGSKELDITNQGQVKAKFAGLKPAVIFHWCCLYRLWQGRRWSQRT